MLDNMLQQIAKWVEGALRKLGYPIELVADRWGVEHPDELARGDYATNVALVLGKEMKKSPIEIANAIAEALNQQIKASPLEFPEVRSWVQKVEVAAPGFINFFLTRDFFTGELKQILKQGDKYGQGVDEAGKKVMIEYTDPNPFKEFHIGHLMSNTIGETISRLIEWQGAEVKRVCYQGDVGLHVAKAIWGSAKLNLPAGKAGAKSVKEWGAAYVLGVRAYDEDDQARAEMLELNHLIYTRDPSIMALYNSGRQASLDYFETIYRRLGTKFDYYFFESESGPVGQKLVQDNLGKIFEKSDGAFVFHGEKRDPDLHTRVFITKGGLPTYEAKELGLAKLKREYWPHDISVVVTGNEITEYFRVVLSAMKEVSPTEAAKIKHVPHGMLRLPAGQAGLPSIKMSSRGGSVVTVESLFESVKGEAAGMIEGRYEFGEVADIAEKVAAAAIKYWILKQAPGRDIIFDLEKALSLEGSSGSYLQYTLVRARSVVEKAAAAGLGPAVINPPSEVTTLERLLYRFPEVAARAARDYAPQFLVTYLTELAAVFNNFYAETRIIDSGSDASYRLALTQAAATVLANGLKLLAIPTPEKM